MKATRGFWGTRVTVAVAAVAVMVLAGGAVGQTQVVFNTAYSDAIEASPNSSKSYSVVLPQAGKLVVTITKTTAQSALPEKSANVQWLNSSGSQLSKTTSGGFSFPYKDSMDLAADNYTIKVVGLGGNGQTGIYSILMDCFVDEKETNNTTSNAQPLFVGYTVRSEASSSSDIDMYKYVLTEPGRMTVNVRSGTLTSNKYVRWYKADGKEIRSEISRVTDFNDYMDLEKGDYYIGITPVGGSGTYTLSGNFVAAGNNEIEPNNDCATAQLLTSGQTVKGFISYQDNIDMYKYVLTEPGRITVNVRSGTLTSNKYVRWYKADGKEIRSEISRVTDFNDYMDLEKGDYYIGITPVSSGSGTYTLSGNFVAAGNNEIEPNNDRATAQLLTSGQTVKGFISYQDNIDMYRYILNADGRMTVNVKSGTLTSNKYVKWYNADGNEIRSEISRVTDFNDYMDREKGTYYIGITPVSGSGSGTYTLTISDPYKPTLTAADLSYDLTSSRTYNGSAQALSVAAKSGITGLGAITVKYNGATTAPTNAGTYAITVSIAAGTNYNATTTDILLGNYVINKANPTAANLTYSLTAKTYTGSAQPVSVTASGLGTVTVKYAGVTTVPINADTYAITVSIAAGTNYNATATDISLGNYIINKATPIASDLSYDLTSRPYNGSAQPLSVTAKSGVTGLGAITVRYGTATTAPTAAGTYAIAVSIAAGTNYNATSSNISLGNYSITTTNAVAPVISTQPLGGTVTAGATFTISVSASVSDGGTRSYQWYSNTSARNSGGTAISGATELSYSVPTSAAGTYYYYVVVTNTIANNGDGGTKTASITSNVATVAVNAINAVSPVISNQPVGGTVTVNAPHTLSISASVSDNGTRSYQWYSNLSANTGGGAVISGAVDSSYSVPTSVAGVYYYYVVVANTIPDNGDGGEKSASQTSNVVTVTVNSLVNAAAPAITEQPVSVEVTVGESCSLTVLASAVDDGTLSYQWYTNIAVSSDGGTPINGATSASYNVPIDDAGTYYYYVVVTNAISDNGDGGQKAASTASAVATVTVEPVVAVLSQDRIVPKTPQGVEAVVIAPISAPTNGLTVGPNPALRSSGGGVVKFFYRGNRINSGVLVIYDAFGNFVKRLKISGNDQSQPASWDLTDKRSRPVAAGAYLVKGSVSAFGEKLERVSAVVVVR